MKKKTELDKIFIAELLSFEDKSELFDGIVDFPVIYLDTLQMRYLKGKKITILYLPDTELKYYTPEKILEFLILTFAHTDSTLLAADPAMYVRIEKLLHKKTTRRLFFNKIDHRRSISSLKRNNFLSFLNILDPHKQKQQLIPAVSSMTKLTKAYDYAHIEKDVLN